MTLSLIFIGCSVLEWSTRSAASGRKVERGGEGGHSRGLVAPLTPRSLEWSTIRGFVQITRSIREGHQSDGSGERVTLEKVAKLKILAQYIEALMATKTLELGGMSTAIHPGC